MITFPLFPIVDGRCTCRDGETCNRIGKHPRVKWGELTESVPHEPGQGYGIRTGQVSGIVVIDLDVKESVNGIKELAALGGVPETRIIKTPTGGYHLYFEYPGFHVTSNAGVLAPGVDVRGDGGFVVGPGSPHKNGGTYEVYVDAPISALPTWLMEKLRERSKAPRAASDSAPTPVDLNTPRGQEMVAMAIQYCKAAPAAIEKQGGSRAMFLVALHLVRELCLPLDEAYEVIVEHYNDRCVPPWTEAEIMHKLEDARDKGESPPGTFSDSLFQELEKQAREERNRVIPAPTRRRATPGHQYSFVPGERVVSGKLQSVTDNELVCIFRHHEEWAGVLQFNELTRRIVAVNPPLQMSAEQGNMNESDAVNVLCWLQSNGKTSSRSAVYDALIAAAMTQKFNPVLDYLNDLPPADPAILDNLAKVLFGNDLPVANEYFKKFLVGAVRRMRAPGSQMDTILVLQGGQGTRKSTFVQALFGEEWTRSQMPDLANKDASAALQGYWGIELAEMDRVLRTETQTVRDFITRRTDDFRKAYSREDERYPRRCVFVGTTNEKDILRDPEGHRRYWPIAVDGRVNIEFLREHRDEIWSAANALAQTSFEHWYENEHDEKLVKARAEFIHEDPWTDKIQEYLEDKVQISNAAYIYTHCIAPGDAGATARVDQKVTVRITTILRRMGWKNVQKWTDGKNKKMWVKSQRA